MSLPEIHKDNIGTVFRFEILNQDDVAVDLSAQTALSIRFRLPDRTTLIVTDPAVVFTTDGTDGKIEYVTLSGDLSQAGTWYRQAMVVIPAGEFWTEQKKFEVKDNIT